MRVIINDETYHRAAEVCQMVGISRSTRLRRLAEGIICNVDYGDWRAGDYLPQLNWIPLEQKPATLLR